MASKHAQSVRERKQMQFDEETGYYASVKLNDLVAHKDPKDVRRQKNDYMKGFLSEQINQ